MVDAASTDTGSASVEEVHCAEDAEGDVPEFEASDMVIAFGPKGFFPQPTLEAKEPPISQLKA